MNVGQCLAEFTWELNLVIMLIDEPGERYSEFGCDR